MNFFRKLLTVSFIELLSFTCFSCGSSTTQKSTEQKISFTISNYSKYVDITASVETYEESLGSRQEIVVNAAPTSSDYTFSQIGRITVKVDYNFYGYRKDGHDGTSVCYFYLTLDSDGYGTGKAQTTAAKSMYCDRIDIINCEATGNLGGFVTIK